MGVKTPLTLLQAQKLFNDFSFVRLAATNTGIIDTTYLVYGTSANYILKKYERDIEEKIIFDAKLLKKLHTAGLNVSLLLAHSDQWYLYKRLKGSIPRTTKAFHLQAIGRFLNKFHHYSSHIGSQENFLQNYPLTEILRELKRTNYFYYKKLSCLTQLTQKCEGFIHGDIFKDNTLFNANKVAIFDFIDGGCGSFSFELGVVLLSFNQHKRKSYTQLLLKSYNQKKVKKITLRELEKSMQDAAKLYSLLRIWHYKNTGKVKELAKLW